MEALSEKISLFPVDQIREEESPWKALIDTSTVSRSIRKASPFKRQLQERKRVRLLYGNLPQRVLASYLKKANKSEDLLLALESRLDIILKRSALFPSVHSARKSILKGSITVNQTTVRSPRHHCIPGDLIQVAQRSLLRKTRSFLQVGKGCKQKKDDLLGLKSETMQSAFKDLFLFSELLHILHKKIGRLYGSVSSLHRLVMRAKAPLLQDMENTSTIEQALSLTNSAKQEHSHARVKLFQAKLIKEGRGARSLNLVMRKMRHIQDSFSNILRKEENLLQKIEFFEICKPFLVPGCNKENYKKTRANCNIAMPSSQKGKERDAFIDVACSELERSSTESVSSRPLHLEVSYRDLCVIFLYPPQRICLDASIDLSLLY